MERRALCVLLILAAALTGMSAQVSAAPNASHQPDPVTGPHARAEARHSGDRLALAPATSLPMPRRAPAIASPTPQALRTSGGRLSREVFGFAPYWALANNANWDYSLMSTVAYFGLTLNGDGSFSRSDPGWTGWNSQALVDMVNRAHQAGDRVVLVIKTFNEATINQIVTSTTVTQTAIDNTLAAIASKRLDGVNVDFEGYTSPSYPNIQSGLTNFVAQLTAQLHQHWPNAMASVDTYSGSASWDSGFFNISALAPVTDALFVMAYDMSFSNTPGHASPNAPLNGWTYNDTTAVSQYLAKAPASKVILGVPYYGYKWSTTSNEPYAATSGGATAAPYSGIAGDFACATNLRVGWDPTGQSPWASWWSPPAGDPCGANRNSWRELYYDDARSLGLKYDLVNARNLRGTGMWALGYEGTSRDLWNAIELKFVYPFRGMYSLEAYGGVHPDGGSLPLKVSAYWYGWKIARSATLLKDASGGYMLDGYGALHPFGQAQAVNVSAYWPSWDIARDVLLLPGSTSAAAQGYVLEGFGGLHAFGGAPPARITGYWNWDAARRAAMLSDGTGGYVLDAFGGLHPFAVGSKPMPPRITNGSYWGGWAIARDLALAPGSTATEVAGVTLDGWGGVHPFGTAGSAAVTGYWPRWDIARAVRFSPVSTMAQPQGWVLDGFGGVHPFGGAPKVTGVAYFPNLDIARQLLVE
jgi:glycosyl hydrolase family 18 (putative chitinase)